MGKLTTHILDTAHGCPGAKITLRLYQGETLLKTCVTNSDGRCDAPLLEGDDFKIGTYKIEFDAAAYFQGKGVTLPQPPFLDVITLHFGIADAGTHYHVPLLVSPYGYSTYRGS